MIFLDNLIYSLNATMPIFLMILLGWVFNRVGMLNEAFCKVANRFVYKISLPAMLLNNMMNCDIRRIFDGKYVGYCAVTTLVSIFMAWGIARICLKDKRLVGEFVQGAYRGSAAILGIALVENISHNTTMAPLMMLGSVPLYNMFAVIVLTLESRGAEHENKKQKMIEAGKDICKNPVIISILGGMLLSYMGIGFPQIIDKTIISVGSLTTPLALLVIGAGFQGKKAVRNIKPAIGAATIKLVVQPLLFLPIAVVFGFSVDQIVAVLVMLGAPTTATAYVMAKSHGHEGILSTSVIVITTLFSAFTITGWIFVLRHFSII